MNYRIVSFFLFLFFSSLSHGKAKKKLLLKRVFDLVLETPNGLGTLEKNLALIDFKSAAFDKAFNPSLSFKNSYTHDESAKTGFPKLKKADIFHSDLEFSKLFSSGTHFKAKFGFAYQNAEFEKLEAGNPMAAFLDSFPPVTLEPKLDLTLSQSLLKNWMARGVKLQKKILSLSKNSSSFQKESFRQALHYEVELLFIHYSHLRGQIQNLEKIRSLMFKMLELVKKQKNIGQSDDLAISKAEYRLVSLAYQIETLESQKDQLKEKLLLTCGLDEEKESYEIESLSFDRKKVFLNSKSAMDFAFKNRSDFKEVEASKEPLYAGIELLKEQYRPNLDLFVNYRSNSKEEEAGKSFEVMAQQKHPSVTVGLNFSMNFGGSTYKKEHAGKLLEIEIADSRREDLRVKVQKEIKLAFMSLEALSRKMKISQKQLEFLSNQLNLEKKKFSQARGSKLSLFSYDIEIEQLKSSFLTLRQEKELILSQIKFLTHSY